MAAGAVKAAGSCVDKAEKNPPLAGPESRFRILTSGGVQWARSSVGQSNQMTEELMKECDRLVDIRMSEKFGVKPSYENWEFDEAFVELEDEGALPGQGTEYPAWRWLVQVDDNAQIATKTVCIAKLLVESCVDGDAFIDDGVTAGISLPGYSKRAVRVALEALAQWPPDIRWR